MAQNLFTNWTNPSLYAKGCFVLLLFLCLVAPARGEDANDPYVDLQAMGFETGTEQLVTTARSLRPISKIAENVTIITSQQIEELNAHTLAEVLNTIPGIQFDRAGRTPGVLDSFSIQGASNGHILVLIDGVSQNELGQNAGNLGIISVQQIERVEIIKGGASAAWGQALGGVVNIITKSPNPDKPFSGSAFSSFGDRFTTEQRGEVTGTIDRLGYYLSGGLLHSDGLLWNNGINQNNIFGKLVYDLPSKGRLNFTGSSANSRMGNEEVRNVPWPDDWHDNVDWKRLHSVLSFQYPLAERLNLEVMGHYTYLKDDNRQGNITPPTEYKHYFAKESEWGTTARLAWGDSRYNLVTGLEYEHDQVGQTQTVNPEPSEQFNKGFNRYGVYSNGTFSYGALTILPGLRYDRIDSDHNEVSYTLGATYRLTEKNVLRAYFARGYSRALAVKTNDSPQEGWTVQVGAETGDIPYLWLKGTVFYNDTWNMPSNNGDPTTSSQIRQGFEIEVRTVPLYGFSLNCGYTMTDLRDKESRIRVQGVPGDLIKLAVIYDNPLWGLHGILNGNYVWWNGSSAQMSEDRNFLWNLHLTQKLLPGNELSPELFLSAYNLFNSAQYGTWQFPNAGRWLEGGVRCKF
jgi:vitamin B12 transporter